MKYHRIGENGSKVKSKRAAGIFFTDGSHVLLLKRSGESSHTGTWALPGGGAREGETDIGTAVRETREETGLETIPGYRIDSLTSQDGHKHFTTFLYRVSSQFDVDLSEEHSDWEWVPFDNLEEKSLHPKFEENLPRYLKAVRRKITSFSEWASFTDLTSPILG
jgi:8-oxo-dGTP pyrophosphatase MutT (NUDIX family)